MQELDPNRPWDAAEQKSMAASLRGAKADEKQAHESLDEEVRLHLQSKAQIANLEVRNADLRERLAEANTARDRDEARIAVLEATLGGAISELEAHDCLNVAEFRVVLSDLKGSAE